MKLWIQSTCFDFKQRNFLAQDKIYHQNESEREDEDGNSYWLEQLFGTNQDWYFCQKNLTLYSLQHHNLDE